MKTPGRSKRTGGLDFGCVRFTVPGCVEFKCYAPSRYSANELDVHYDIVKVYESECREMAGIQGKCKRSAAKCKRCASLIKLPPDLFTKSNGKLKILPGKLQVLKNNICKEVGRVFEFHRKDHVVEGDASHQGSALTKSPAECSSMPALSLRQGPNKFEQTMNKLKKLPGTSAYRNLLAVLEEEHKAKARELEDLKKMQSVTEGLQSAPKNTGTRIVDSQSILPQLKDPNPGEEVRTEQSRDLTIAEFSGWACVGEIPSAPLPKPSASNVLEGESSKNRRYFQPRSTDFGTMEDNMRAEDCFISQSPKDLAEVPENSVRDYYECNISPGTFMQTEDQFQDGPSGEGLDSGAVSQENPAGGCTFMQNEDGFQDNEGLEAFVTDVNIRDELINTRQSTEQMMHPRDDNISDPWKQDFYANYEVGENCINGPDFSHVFSTYPSLDYSLDLESDV